MSNEYIVTVNFAGLVGADVDYEVSAENEEWAKQDALDLAADDLTVEDWNQIAAGEWEIEIGFAGFIGVSNMYTVMADTEDQASDAAIEEAISDLEVTRCVIDDSVLDPDAAEYLDLESKISGFTNRILEGADVCKVLSEASTVLQDRGITSTDDVDELVLYISNDGDLYRGRTRAIIDNLKKKYKKGNYDPELAIKAFMYLVDDGVRKYDKEFGSGGGKLFLDKATRTEIARQLRDRYEEEIMED